MSDSTKAVFLSYARDDAAAARRIAEALRASGLEVWFDENELRGGDTWDAKIRQQIDACALFVPLISQHTQERSKGYFRLEWKLAVDQTHLLAEGVPFIAPVVIDATTEAGALVPAEFLKVQWTRLPGALPTPQFVEQVKRLLAGKPVEAGRSRPAARNEDAAPAKKSGVPRWALGGGFAVVVAIATAVYVAQKPAPVAPPVAPAEAKPASTQTIIPLANDKSIAVLPFTNMSDDKDSGFFADGVHEDILTNLALIRELRVVSRTSVMPYRTTAKSMRQIASELGVTYILEGSVRRSGNKVRVTGQLIHAATDEHVWAEAYDRDLTDVFSIQAELSKKIASELKAALSPEEKKLLERRPTTNTAAYDLYLKARQMNNEGNDTRDELEAEAAMLESATGLDPGFAGAWADLSGIYSQMRANFYDFSAARLAKARAAMETAQRLDPDNPAVIAGAGDFYYYALHDYPRALEHYERLMRMTPNSYSGPFRAGLVLRRQGKWLESLALLHRAAELDPGSAELARNLMVSYRAMRRYRDAIAEQERRVRLLPESLRESFELVRLHFLADGSTREGDELLAGPIAERAGEAAAGYLKQWAASKGDLAAALRIDRERPDLWGPITGGANSLPDKALEGATVSAASGDMAAARGRLEKYPAELRARLVNESENPGLWNSLAKTEALLGHKDEALAAARRSQELLPEARDALSGYFPGMGLAFVQAWTGDKDGAIAGLRHALAINGNVNVHLLKNGPWFAPLKDDPRFQALVNDPKNNAPLF